MERFCKQEGVDYEKCGKVIVATSERGLCGGFNSSIVKLAKNKISELVSSGNNVKIYTIVGSGVEYEIFCIKNFS